MIYAEIRNQEEQRRLDDAIQASEKRSWYRRLQIIAYSAKNSTVQQLSKSFGVCEQTIRNYINGYNEGGLDKLMPIKQTGRPPKIANWTKEDWDKVLKQTPNQYKKLNTHSRQWTLKRLALYLKEYHQIEVTIPCVCNALQKTGRRTERSKLKVRHPEPEYNTIRHKSINAM